MYMWNSSLFVGLMTHLGRSSPKFCKQLRYWYYFRTFTLLLTSQLESGSQHSVSASGVSYFLLKLVRFWVLIEEMVFHISKKALWHKNEELHPSSRLSEVQGAIRGGLLSTFRDWKGEHRSWCRRQNWHFYCWHCQKFQKVSRSNLYCIRNWQPRYSKKHTLGQVLIHVDGMPISNTRLNPQILCQSPSNLKLKTFH